MMRRETESDLESWIAKLWPLGFQLYLPLTFVFCIIRNINNKLLTHSVAYDYFVIAYKPRARCRGVAFWPLASSCRSSTRRFETENVDVKKVLWLKKFNKLFHYMNYIRLGGNFRENCLWVKGLMSADSKPTQLFSHFCQGFPALDIDISNTNHKYDCIIVYHLWTINKLARGIRLAPRDKSRNYPPTHSESGRGRKLSQEKMRNKLTESRRRVKCRTRPTRARPNRNSLILESAPSQMQLMGRWMLNWGLWKFMEKTGELRFTTVSTCCAPYVSRRKYVLQL